MKLHEIARVRRSTSSETLTIEPAGGIYGEVEVEVSYSYEGASHTQHEPDNSSFREYHPPELDIKSVKLVDEVAEQDEDGQPTGKIWPKGADATKLPDWAENDDRMVHDALLDKLETDTNDNFVEPGDDYY